MKIVLPKLKLPRLFAYCPRIEKGYKCHGINCEPNCSAVLDSLKAEKTS